MPTLKFTTEAAATAGVTERRFRERAQRLGVKPKQTNKRNHLWTVAQVRRVARSFSKPK